jgi:hypothetical protein
MIKCVLLSGVFEGAMAPPPLAEGKIFFDGLEEVEGRMAPPPVGRIWAEN